MSQDDSVRTHQAAVAAAASRFGTGHRETLKARNLLGLVLYHAGRPADAERELRAAKDDCARLLGTADLETLFS
jgi:hypothetical protein